jgi:hypothetical protein
MRSNLLPPLKWGSFPAHLFNPVSGWRHHATGRPVQAGLLFRHRAFPCGLCATLRRPVAWGLLAGAPSGVSLSPLALHPVGRAFTKGLSLQRGVHPAIARFRHRGLYQRTSRSATNVSIFQRVGAFFPPLPLKWRGFQKEEIGDPTPAKDGLSFPLTPDRIRRL